MADGAFALLRNTTGNYNVGEGLDALFNNTTGNSNIAIGTSAGSNLTTGGGNIDIGNAGVATEFQTIRIGSTQRKAFLAGVRGTVVSGGMAVYVSASGQLGTNPSSKRFKEDIVPMAKQSEAILKLKPVSFRYKKELDPQKLAQFGLIAEEVAKVDPALVIRDAKGQICAVRYEAINAMLLNEFLKAHHTLTEQATEISQLNSVISKQEKAIAALSSHLEKVDAKVTLNQRSAAKVVTNQ